MKRTQLSAVRERQQVVVSIVISIFYSDVKNAQQSLDGRIGALLHHDNAVK